MQDDKENKNKTIHNAPHLKDLVKDSGILCVSIGLFDYMQIGQSVFVGLRVVKPGCCGLAIIAPKTDKIQRYVTKK